MNNLLLDTNILIYALDENSKFHQRAKNILTDGKYNFFITSKNISEFFAVCTKLNLDKDKIWGFYNEIKTNAIILYPSGESIKKFEMLIKKYSPFGNRVYDIEIASIMLANKVLRIATLNITDFENINEINLLKF